MRPSGRVKSFCEYNDVEIVVNVYCKNVYLKQHLCNWILAVTPFLLPYEYYCRLTINTSNEGCKLEINATTIPYVTYFGNCYTTSPHESNSTLEITTLFTVEGWCFPGRLHHRHYGGVR